MEKIKILEKNLSCSSVELDNLLDIDKKIKFWLGLAFQNFHKI